MNVLFALMLLWATPQQVDTGFTQVMPEGSTMARTKDQPCAIVLINGLSPHPFSEQKANEAQTSGWQEADSKLVAVLKGQGDLFAFSYSQNVAVDAIADAANKKDKRLVDWIKALRKLGYTKIVLIGHSAGALVARRFVEDHPTSGVTKVIQVCPPNGGAGLAELSRGVREDQEVFVESLDKDEREKINKERGEAGKVIPPKIEFIVLMGKGGVAGDVIVSRESQWPEDLQEQGIPVLDVITTHFTVMRSSRVARKIATLIKDPQPRWSKREVKEAVDDLLD